MPEIVQDGLSGYLVDGVTEAIERVDAATMLDRGAVAPLGGGALLRGQDGR